MAKKKARKNPTKRRKKKPVKPPAKRKPRHALARQDVFEEFVKWFATPTPLRDPPTQQDFADKFGVNRDTPTDWKKREEFLPAVKAHWKQWGIDKTSNVMEALYRHIVKKGESKNFKLWFQYFLDFTEWSVQEFDGPVKIVHEFIDAKPGKKGKRHAENDNGSAQS
jgi:hypothetical protein